MLLQQLGFSLFALLAFCVVTGPFVSATELWATEVSATELSATELSATRYPANEAQLHEKMVSLKVSLFTDNSHLNAILQLPLGQIDIENGLDERVENAKANPKTHQWPCRG